MIAFLKRFWKWILGGLASVAFGVTLWQVRRLQKKIKLLELDKFVLETEAKNSIKKTEIMYDRFMVEAIQKEAQRLLSQAADKGVEIQRLEQELKQKLGDNFKDWDALESAAKGANGHQTKSQ